MPLSSAVVQTLRVRPQLQSAVRDAMSRVVSPSGTEPNSPPAPEEVLLSCYRTKTEQLGSSSSVQPHMSASAYRSSPVEYIPAPKPSLTPSSKPKSKETRVKGRSNLAEEQRRLNLESDRFAKIISPILVECIGCGRHVKLDARGTYYTQFWYKHRDGCEAIPKEDRIVHVGSSKIYPPLQAVLIIFLCQSSISGERKSAYFRTGQKRHCVTSRNLTRKPTVPSRKSARRRRRCQQSNFISRVSYTFTHPVIHLSACFTTFHRSLLLLLP